MKRDLFVSRLVTQEASAGDRDAAQRRLAELDPIPLLDFTEDALSLARDLVYRGVLPGAATEDALHIAVAAVHGMDYLLTWNCRHIANARMRQAVGRPAPCEDMSRRSFARRKSLWETSVMWEDPIVEEVRKAREEHAAKFHYDLDAIYRDLKAQDERDPRRVVSLPPKRPATAHRTS